MRVVWRVPQQVLQFQAESEDERVLLPLLVPGGALQARFDGDRVEWYSPEVLGLPPSISADWMMLKTYDAAGVCQVTELQDALRPELRERLAGGGAYQLVVWGQGGTPSFVPQRASPLHCLGTDEAATGTGPAP